MKHHFFALASDRSLHLRWGMCVLLISFILSIVVLTPLTAHAKQQERLPQSKSKSTSSKPALPTGTTGDDPAYAAFRKGRYLEALKLATAAAKKGEPQAFTLIGQIYAGGLGVPKDLAKAAQWYAGGSEQGDKDSQFALGLQLLHGRGIKKDVEQAAGLFEAAAGQGHRLSQYNMGLIYAAGTGRTVDMAKAAHWFEAAAQQNEARAQYDLGTLYREGVGVPQDSTKAAQWLKRAADADLTVAQLEYGLMLYLGKGITKDEKAGASLLLRAAQKGNGVAQNRVAKLYAHGLVFSKDLIEAGKWHLLSRELGIADIRLDLMLARLKKDDRLKAKTKAREWRRKNQLQ